LDCVCRNSDCCVDHFKRVQFCTRFSQKCQNKERGKGSHQPVNVVPCGSASCGFLRNVEKQ
uniref:Uncharacterized protein n=1 Tax=Romanomermis culicivorax TaxID=13658 RepID=A0A915J017_ROMCU